MKFSKGLNRVCPQSHQIEMFIFLRLFAFLNLPNTQAFATLRKPKIHQKSKPFKNQALYGQTLNIPNSVQIENVLSGSKSTPFMSKSKYLQNGLNLQNL